MRGALQIGQALPRWDAPAKTTGAERFAADLGGGETLWAGVKRSGLPHARLVAVDSAAALQVSGVLAVLTHEDVGGTNRQGAVRKDHPVLVNDKSRHCGDPVALVVAESREALEQALAALLVAWEPLAAVLDPHRALEAGSPLVHEDWAGGNVLLAPAVRTGEGAAAFEACTESAELCLELPRQEHAYLETEGGRARVGDDGRVTIEASTQTPFRDRAEVAEALGLDPARVRVIAPACGGAFGGKDGITVQTLLALAALRFPGRAVKMVWSREESFVASAKRHAARVHCRLGAKADGTFHAFEARLVYDTGPYDHLGGVVVALGLEHAPGPYRIPHVALEGKAVYTNNPIGGAFRGFGVPQVAAVTEQVVDLLAARLALDPVELRRRNLVRKGDRNAVGVTLTGSVGAADCLERLAAHPLWRDRESWKAGAPPFTRRGTGLASIFQAMGYGPVVPDVAHAKVELTAEGRFRVYCGVVDLGQGNGSTFLQMAGDLLNQDGGHLELVLPDTDRTLPCGSASASRTTFTFGNALLGACGVLKERLLLRAADLLLVSGAAQFALAPGLVRHLPTGREFPLARLAAVLGPDERTAVFRYQAPTAPEDPTGDPYVRAHGIPHLVYSYGAHLARVEVDELTGRVEVRDYLAVHDCGRVLNPQLWEQQVQGGVAQGLGYALLEDFQVDEGRVVTKNFSTYGIPTALDLPEFTAVAVELHEPSGPFGLKGSGELPVNGPLPAVANAVADACGVRVLHPPLTAERVLAGLREPGVTASPLWPAPRERWAESEDRGKGPP